MPHALQLHPRSPALYLLLSQHYLDPSVPAPTNNNKRRKQSAPNFAIENVSPARKTLLLGLRFMPDNRDLWREYIKLEIGWVEALRRRWRVLGIDVDLAGDDAAEQDEKMEQDVQAGLPAPEDDDADTVLGQHAFGASGETARKAIIRGDLIITVLSSTFSHPVLGNDLEFHLSLIHLFRRYPTGLRLRLLDAVYDHIEHAPALRWNPVAQRTVIERALYDAPYDPERESKQKFEAKDEDRVVLSGEALVAELGKIVKSLRAKGSSEEAASDQPQDWEQKWNEEVGLWLLRWAGHEQVVANEALQAYLVASVNPLTKPSAKPTETLLVRHLEFIDSLDGTSAARPSPEKILALTRNYTSLYPASVPLWMTRLRAETAATGETSELAHVYLQAMTGVGASSENASKVWTTAMRWFDAHVASSESEDLTAGEAAMGPHWRQAIKAARKYVGDVHTRGDLGEQLYASLLLAWVEGKLATTASVAQLGPVVRQVCSPTWDASYHLFPPLFHLISSNTPADAAAQVAPLLSTIHNLRLTKARNELDRVDAVLDWASWAMTTGAGTGQVRPAWTAIENLKKEIEAREIKPGVAQLEGERIKRDALAKLDVGWKAILAEVEARAQQSEDDDDDVEMQ
ncbi:hypothetical protein QFC22_006645 [Naganishia vaughanmartiniae]|uniref:Uncharacterized protein n=1 Tax=Naganishia vaughanmartiniae TaxID=1424756 RepID=A0ACC2WII6_9TREE|nr:hypothetical protein QFC22_006645 [Naganishia vaughanmartiniae]